MKDFHMIFHFMTIQILVAEHYVRDFDMIFLHFKAVNKFLHSISWVATLVSRQAFSIVLLVYEVLLKKKTCRRLNKTSTQRNALLKNWIKWAGSFSCLTDRNVFFNEYIE